MNVKDVKRKLMKMGQILSSINCKMRSNLDHFRSKTVSLGQVVEKPACITLLNE
jgi:hypothetical protein